MVTLFHFVEFVAQLVFVSSLSGLSCAKLAVQNPILLLLFVFLFVFWQLLGNLVTGNYSKAIV